ncbi:D-alanyl-D-alanine carboxypeptidase [Agrobacterium tumefaciens]|jgi:D-alanyl-D-alanine carboxypeptidase (penicillin-binding protein 5/6)|uniref:D-alanyl-D-alanine carboxypeptidase n=1 Tax=Agrobacterium tumefaciens TaxID=358 RepID=A0AAW8M0H7_AGRTU|nr:serine hydrolase [Agrobacterium tumefaciens]MBP2542219.1 D-alanyl-D-alanine carboxypeptidase [Agrobacterium tumefaciens]MBP2568073.1 D-alanyl-D-alanine carboxypeptidase [Agrobacterium tumefaciens]MDP9791260.1 D-alanyl-D-alanine carboxypeptidase [Agrobacterium tumefaciens]MDR6704830.1 D-alanyl-D-alanine carboxypeptidase [Agrobacterium tumefaciens]
MTELTGHASYDERKSIGPTPDLAAKSAICLELAHNSAGSDVIIYEKDADKAMAPASIVKLMTAIVAIETASDFQLPKSFKLEMIPEDDVDGSGRNLHAGDCLSLGDSIANLLVPSSNVAANLIARTFGEMLLGSKTGTSSDAVQRFVAEMNTIARNLGMTKSQFLNPHGLAVRGQRSTARDLSLLVKKCLIYGPITRGWGARAFAIGITGSSPRRLVVKSAFHSSTQRAVPGFSLPQYLGGKTGTLWPSHFNLAAVSSTKNGGICVSVSLGSPTVEERYHDYMKLVDLSNELARGTV